MKHHWRWLLLMLVALGFLKPAPAGAQIDPVKRSLIQFGYNASLEGHAPLSAYMFAYINRPEFYRTNLTLRLAIAPTYIDSELGISHVLGENTDMGIGLAGGGFAYSYAEIRQGKYEIEESFVGHGGEGSLSLYHLFNPGQTIPLNGVLRGLAHFPFYERSSDTDPNFKLPPDYTDLEVRTGLRWGGREPTLFPSLAMELSVWYLGEFRTKSGTYGYNDRQIESQSHLFWAQAMLAYTLPELKHNFYISLLAGTSVDADRFSAYRLGSLLPLVSEFPLSLPGYYYQEISADKFVLLGANYLAPIDSKQHWNINLTAATAGVDYISGLEQPGNWHSGVGGGLLYRSPSWKVMLGYAYGVDAIRSGHRGANSIGFLLQIDLERAKDSPFNPTQPNLWQGMQRMFGLFGN